MDDDPHPLVRVWRRIPEARTVADPGQPHGWRCQSGAFIPRAGERTSVDGADGREAAGELPETMLDGCAGRWGVAEVAVDARLVEPKPLPDNPFHAELWGTTKDYRRMAQAAWWVVPPFVLPDDASA